MPPATPRADRLEPELPLGALRAELDRIDDAIHDALMRRAALVADAAALRTKTGTAWRPGREAAILRRLLARNRPPLRPETVLGIWREILVGSTAQQGAPHLLVGAPALLPGACEQFRPAEPPPVLPPRQALAALREVGAGLAVLPFPAPGGGDDDWWTELPGSVRPLYVVARLPLVAHPGTPESLVVSPAEPDPSGHDRTLFAGASAPPGTTTLARSGDRFLLELAGFRTDAPPGLIRIGAYAIPFGEQP